MVDDFIYIDMAFAMAAPIWRGEPTHENFSKIFSELQTPLSLIETSARGGDSCVFSRGNELTLSISRSTSSVSFLHRNVGRAGNVQTKVFSLEEDAELCAIFLSACRRHLPVIVFGQPQVQIHVQWPTHNVTAVEYLDSVISLPRAVSTLKATLHPGLHLMDLPSTATDLRVDARIEPLMTDIKNVWTEVSVIKPMVTLPGAGVALGPGSTPVEGADGDLGFILEMIKEAVSLTRKLPEVFTGGQ